MIKNYGQFCGLAKASSVLGERWSLLIARDLSVVPRRFKDLHEGLPGIPTSLLTTRLRDLQLAGVITRVAAEQPGGGVLYGLTPHGKALEPILDALGRWGASVMDTPEPDDVITDVSLAAALRAGFQSGVIEEPSTFAVHAGPATAWARASAESILVGAGAPEFEAGLVIHSGPKLRALLAGSITPQTALESGAVRIDGAVELFERFTQAFSIPQNEIITSHEVDHSSH